MPPLAAAMTVDDFNDDENLAADSLTEERNLTSLRRTQRRITELEAQLEKERSIKKPPTLLYVFFPCPFYSSKQHLARKTFTTLGRCIPKVVTPFGSIDDLIAENDRRMDLDDKRTEGDDIHDEEPEHTIE
jgi:hypothetical protein